MKKIVTKIICIPMFLLLMPSILTAQDDYFLTLSNSRTRAIAMGGAFTAIEDDLNAISYNPATFTLFQVSDVRRFSVFVNPVLPVVAFRQADRFDLNKSTNNTMNGLRYLIKGFTFSTSFMDAGILLNEEKYIVRDTDYFFDGKDMNNNVFHSMVVNFKLSSQANFGVSGSYVLSEEGENVKKTTAISYGLLIRPSLKYQVGITFFDMSNEIKSLRRKFERFADESLNIGLAIFPFEGGVISVDARNVTESEEEKNFALQEFHFGAEFSKIKHISLRAGFYREEFTLQDNLEFQEISKYDFGGQEFSKVFSFGVGIIDLNLFRSYSNRLSHSTPLISYAMILKDTPLGRVNWHFLSLNIRIN
ncbi:hypothetical protein ACFL6G_06205 [candidate division KSB1 bacterium]